MKATELEVVSTWQRFAEITIQTNDLDPLYQVFHCLRQKESDEWMGRMLVYFLLFYHVGNAIDAADTWSDEDFWINLYDVANDPKTPRGTERRHFRGQKALFAVQNLSGKGLSPWSTLSYMYKPSYREFFHHVVNNYKGTQFGPYFIWKLYDIFNVCLGMPISMSTDEAWAYMPDEPKKVAALMGNKWTVPPATAFARVNHFVGSQKHPFLNRMCGPAETETVLCMLKGYFLTKTHVIGDDIVEKWHQLKDYPSVQDMLPPFVGNKYTRGELE